MPFQFQTSVFCFVFPHYSFLVIFPEAQHYYCNPKLSNHILTFTVLWVMFKIHRLHLHTLHHLKKKRKKKKGILITYFSLLLQENKKQKTKNRAMNKEWFRFRQSGCFCFYFPFSFVQLLDWVLQITLTRDKGQCTFITQFYILS